MSLQPIVGTWLLVALCGCTELLGVEERTLATGGGGGTSEAGGGAGGTGDAGGTGGAGGALACFLECSGACVDPFTSAEHCGRCDHPCAEGAACLDGICDKRLRSNTGSYTQCVRTASELSCWGVNASGQRGDGTANLDENAPPTVVSALPQDATALFASSAGSSTCAIIADGRLLCFGENHEGSLGLGPAEGGPDDGASAGCCHFVDAVAPLLPDGAELIDAAGGGWWDRAQFYCALAKGGDVYCWGNAAEVPTKKIEQALQIEAGIAFGCALVDRGEVWCWIPPEGSTFDNAVVLGVPFRIEGLPTIRAIGVALSVGYAIDTEGQLWAWGPSAEGLLGPGTNVDDLNYYPPRAFGFTFASPIVQVTGTGSSACALQENGDVYCWGANGTQGDGTPYDGQVDSTPKKAFTEDIQEIAASNYEMVARHANGQVLHWSGQHLMPTPLLLP